MILAFEDIQFRISINRIERIIWLQLVTGIECICICIYGYSCIYEYELNDIYSIIITNRMAF